MSTMSTKLYPRCMPNYIPSEHEILFQVSNISISPMSAKCYHWCEHEFVSQVSMKSYPQCTLWEQNCIPNEHKILSQIAKLSPQCNILYHAERKITSPCESNIISPWESKIISLCESKIIFPCESIIISPGESAIVSPGGSNVISPVNSTREQYLIPRWEWYFMQHLIPAGKSDILFPVRIISYIWWEQYLIPGVSDMWEQMISDSLCKISILYPVQQQFSLVWE